MLKMGHEIGPTFSLFLKTAGCTSVSWIVFFPPPTPPFFLNPSLSIYLRDTDDFISHVKSHASMWIDAYAVLPTRFQLLIQ